MRAVRGDGGPLHDEFHPVSGFVYEQRLSVQVQ